MQYKLKVLYTIPNFNTAGSGKVVYDLVKGIDKAHFAPEILVKHTRGAFFKEVEKLGVPIHVFDYETAYYPLWSFPFRLLKVVNFFKSLDVDIIHSWHWSSDFSEALAAKLAGIKYVYTKKNMGWGNKAWVWKSKLSHQVIAINKDMVKRFFNPIPSIKAVYLPLSIDTDYYSPKPLGQVIAEQCGIKKDDFVVISVANLIPLKGIEVLIHAFKKLNLKDKKLILVGNNKNEYGKKLMLEYKDDNILFTGKQIDVRPYLSLANIFCIPTLSVGEGQGLAPLEAMSMGIPVLGSRVSGITDILEGFEEYLFEAGNDKELAIKLNKINEMPSDKVISLGEKMRKKVEKEYSFSQFINSRQKVYQKLVK